MWDYVVIGSGFGGAVTACRMAERGHRVLVLERGRRWKERDFPVQKDLIYSHEHPAHLNGWVEFRIFPHMTVFQGAGVGGGSLVYANISTEARPDVFEQGWPEAITYRELKPYYDRVARFMNVQKVPANQVPERYKLVRDGAAALNWQDRFTRLDLCVEFDRELDLKALRAAPNPDAFEKRFTNQHGQEVGRCLHCGNCDLGCEYGAKSTLEMNYLPVAEKYGAKIRPKHIVRAIEPADGSYLVHYDRVVKGELRPGSVRAKNVIVAAGFNSIELLLRCRDHYRTLPRLSKRLGHGWSSNGDFLTPAVYARREPRPHEGPTITAAIDLGDGIVDEQKFWIQDGGYPNVLLNALRELDVTRARAVAAWYENIFDRNIMPWFAQGVDAGNGRLKLSRKWPWLWQRELSMNWPPRSNRQVFDSIADVHHRLAKATGGKPIDLKTWTWFRTLITPHPLGGCSMGDDIGSGVVDDSGAVFGYPGLYVADCSIVPTPIGRNPSRTIAALAERIAEKMPA